MIISKELLKSNALKFNVELDDTAINRFNIYAEMLIDWNSKINLTSITEPDEIVLKHFVDSIALMKYIELTDKTNLIDVGTGAGFPGVALLIANPNLNVTLLDGTKKKLNVIESILDEIGLNARIVHSRAEEAGRNNEYREKFDVVTARAVSNLRNLSEYCLPFVKVGGKFAPLKSISAGEELSEAKRAITTLGGEYCKTEQYIVDGCGERAVILVKKISQTSTKYPRNSSQISKKPLV